ncbi:unnamed protein product [Peronospora destructor]|uniref:TRUD domain-containing protein n=1 Tax=Peronospora destructor TaxID=86335 RepID=A0AAV0V7I9_9STRA|nr:unnamed protein product [Peronospora destructor]
MRCKASVLDGSVVGMEEFVDNCRGRLIVRGFIKTKPEDFTVHEISRTGEVVNFNEESDRLPTNGEYEAILNKLEAAQPKEKKTRIQFDEPEDGWQRALTELIGAKGFGDVESVATGRTENTFVASPTEFQQRVYLQVCIQNCFPGLDCKMHKASSFEDRTTQQIQVVVDPVYKKLREGGMTLENCKRLLTFLRKGANDPAASKGLELEHEDTKEARTMLHRLIAKNSACFKTKTEARNGIQHLVVYFVPKSYKKRKRSQPQVYLRFVLQKTNQEHFSAFDKLARRIRCPLSAFSYAGTKDKTAITFQHVVVSAIEPNRLLSVNMSEDDATAAIRVGNLTYVESPMSLGGANGNRFTITIRSLSSESQCASTIIRSTLESALNNIEHQGFINYFGFQRVGLPTSIVRAHHIGEKMIANKWEEALRLILEVKDEGFEATVKAKRLYLESGDVEAALKVLPHGMSIERQVLQGLKRHGSDAFEQAVETVAFSRRVMYMHAYQSFLFNRMASFRLRHYGTKVVEGDLIQCDTLNGIAVKAVTTDEANELNETCEQALRLVMLPLAGTNVLFPSNTTKDACIKIMEQDGTKKALFESGALKGAYRSLVAYPHDLEWAWQQDQNESLTLQLSFSLDSGCFATMCLRELLHSDM